jgi:hypothetical protein
VKRGLINGLAIEAFDLAAPPASASAGKRNRLGASQYVCALYLDIQRAPARQAPSQPRGGRLIAELGEQWQHAPLLGHDPRFCSEIPPR